MGALYTCHPDSGSELPQAKTPGSRGLKIYLLAGISFGLHIGNVLSRNLNG